MTNLDWDFVLVLVISNRLSYAYTTINLKKSTIISDLRRYSHNTWDAPLVTPSISLSFSFWLKSRILYLFNNWVYTTNHKRIAVNYFWFVILAGVVGLVLATAIRLEFAYPGVGVFAGDSLQYLSVVSAHGVIMVFFMIMPLLFGAFGNFLLPTQLGVHDVAFPRLNSAAFWFLPGGLLMLAQLVCVDRRFQRMNCFNMREIQAILKQRFFADIYSGGEYHKFLDQTLIGLKMKTNAEILAVPHSLAVARFPIRGDLLNRPFEANTSFSTVLSSYENVRIGSVEKFVILVWKGFSLTPSISSPWEFISQTPLKGRLLWGDLISTFRVQMLSGFEQLRVTCFVVARELLTPLKWFSLVPDLETVKFSLFSLGVCFWNASFFYTSWFSTSYSSPHNAHTITPSTTSFDLSETLLLSNLLSKQNLHPLYWWGETELESRTLRASNPLFKYDYKGGNYLPKSTRESFTHLFPSIMNISGALRPSAWFLSSPLVDNVLANFSEFVNYGAQISNATVGGYASRLNFNSHTFSFFAPLKYFGDDTNLGGQSWFALVNLSSKFSKMFLSSPMQHRIYGNWRQLKFTREAWRCKLLATRHQRTFYRRYVDEDGTFWSIERNARDLIPGWAMITPFSSRTRFTAIGKVDIGLIGVLLVLNSSIVSGANFLVTYRYLSTLNNRKMRDARSFFAEGVMVASWMMIAANPMLVIGIIMLLSDRHWQTSFFDYSGGGDTVLFQHMFWFFGHPEVYVIMIPVFGFVNTILSYYLRKRVSARASLMYSMYTIAFLGFFVWGHHMYMVGLAHTTRMLFSTLTVMISVPAATKLMHWCVTLANSSFVMELPLLFTLTFIFFFISGGISGMCVAHTGMDVLFHDTFYVIGHFHVMLAGGAMFGSWGAFYFYFPAIFGVKYSRIYAYFHYSYYLLGQFMTVIPMFWLGYAGMPRRVLDYPASMGGWHSVISAGHLLSVAGVLAFFLMIFDSLRQSKASLRGSFGISRFNTRLSFYLFEIARLQRHYQKNAYLTREFTNKTPYFGKWGKGNWEFAETTLFSYALLRLSKNA